MVIKNIIYIIAFVIANYLVLYFGKIGLIFSAIFLIPFDFVMRCLFHETWKGKMLIIKLGILVIISSLITFIINYKSQNIALASALGFIIAQIFSGIFYQININKNYFIKVNGSDAIGILVDSIIFQIIAFNIIDYKIIISQFLLKVSGGLFWYWLLFNKLKLQDKWL